jgi:hypothetical protein
MKYLSVFSRQIAGLLRSVDGRVGRYCPNPIGSFQHLIYGSPQGDSLGPTDLSIKLQDYSASWVLIGRREGRVSEPSEALQVRHQLTECVATVVPIVIQAKKRLGFGVACEPKVVLTWVLLWVIMVTVTERSTEVVEPFCHAALRQHFGLEGIEILSSTLFGCVVVLALAS